MNLPFIRALHKPFFHSPGSLFVPSCTSPSPRKKDYSIFPPLHPHLQKILKQTPTLYPLLLKQWPIQEFSRRLSCRQPSSAAKIDPAYQLGSEY